MNNKYNLRDCDDSVHRLSLKFKEIIEEIQHLLLLPCRLGLSAIKFLIFYLAL